MNKTLGAYIRKKRLALRKKDTTFSLRRVAARIGVEPSFLSKVERGLAPPPSEKKLLLLAETLSEDPDVLLALAGRVSTDLQDVIRKRPQLLANLIRALKAAPDASLSRMVREARAEYGQKRHKRK